MTRPCGRPVNSPLSQRPCAYPRLKGKQRCLWHWLIAQPSDVQASHAQHRLTVVQEAGQPYCARVNPLRWPEGERWCAGCQTMVPLFYTTGSRCKACASAAAHESRVQKTYGLEPGEYDRLFEQQGGRCFICQRRPRSLRLAVDHDHATGEARGLLCANNENGCNRGVVANLEAAHDGGLAAARRAVLYLVAPPRSREVGRDYSWRSFIASETARLAAEAAQERPSGTRAHNWSV